VSDVVDASAAVLREATAGRAGGATLRHLEATAPSGATEQRDCPFLEAGLVDLHAAGTWPSGAVPPADGSAVTLPANRSVLISHCSLAATGTYGVITVPASSRLVFNDEEGIAVRTRGVLVLGQLLMGSASCRLRSAVNVTLDAPRVSGPTPFSYKGVAVEEQGKLSALSAHSELFMVAGPRSYS
jgi:hypothetical protein